MLKNRIVIRKIRNIVILLMAILIMIGAYKNIDRSRAENVIEISAIALDNYGCIENEGFTLEAKEISDGLYEIEIPENINTKQVNKVIEVTIESKTQGENTDGTETIEITDNKIYLTAEQIEKNEIKFKTVYDVAITAIDEQGKYSKDLLSEMTEEEITEVKTMTNGEGLLYNRTLKYEENGKIIEVKGYMLEDVELDIQEVTQEQISETYGEIQINFAYNIKTTRKVENKGEQGIATEIIEINPLQYGEIFEVSITDSKVQQKSNVYYLKDVDTCNEVEVNENTDGNIKFNMYYSGIYVVKQQQLSFMEGSTETEEGSTAIEGNMGEEQTEEGETDSTESEENAIARHYFTVASGAWRFNVNSYPLYTGVRKSMSYYGDASKTVEYVYWSTSTNTPTTWNTVESLVNNNVGGSAGYNYFGFPGEGVWYLHVKTTDGSTYYGGPYELIQDASYGAGVSASVETTATLNYNGTTVNVKASNGETLVGSSVRAKWLKTSERIALDESYIDTKYPTRQVTSETSTVRKHGVGIPDPIYEYDEEGNKIDIASYPEGEYYLQYKYWGQTNQSGSGTAYGNSSFVAFDKQGPSIRLSYVNDCIYGIEGSLQDWYNTDVNVGVIVNDGWSKTQKLEYSENGENWLTIFDAGNVEIGSNGDAIGESHTLTEERTFSDVYFRATDRVGNVGKIFSLELGIDKTNPTIEVNINSDTTYTKTKDIIITANDLLSGLDDDKTSYEYYLSESSTSLIGGSGSWKSYINGQTTTIGEGLTGGYYLFVKPVTDKAGNTSKTDYHMFGPYYFDNEAPTISLSDQENEMWAKNHSVTVTVTDAHKGLAKEQRVRYGWSTSTSTVPSEYTYVTLANTVGEKSTTFIATGSGLTGEYYLWVETLKGGGIIDGLGNLLSTKHISTGKFYFDNDAPTITLESNSNTTYAKTHSVTVTLADGHSGLVVGSSQNIKYGWSTSTTEEPSNYIPVTLSNSEGEANTTFTATTPSGLATDKYYLWVVPYSTNYVKDKLGNTNSTPVKSTGTFWIDNTAPTITLSEQKNETWAKTHSVIVTLTDEQVGLAEGSNQNIKYGWSLSNTEEPSEYTTVRLSNSEGTTSTTFTAEGSGFTGEYYLWVVPYSTNYVKDKLGNTNTTPVKSTGKFYFDNEVPIITLGSNGNTTYSKTHSVTVTLADGEAGLAAGENQSVKYGWCRVGEAEPSSYTLVTLSNSEGATSTTFIAEGSGLTGEYYLWVVPVSSNYVGDKLGNKNSTPEKSTGTFYFDNQAPTEPILSSVHPSDAVEYESGDWTNYFVRTTVSSTDEHSGIASIQYSIDKTNWITIDGELTQSGIQKSGIIDWELVERDDSYYFKIIDNVGNEYISSSSMFNIKYDLTNPEWSYKDKEIYYSTLNDVGNEAYANRERTVKIIFEGIDEGGRDVTSTLNAENITILVNGTEIQDQALSVKTLDTVNNGSGKVTCTLTLKGILGDGDLTVSIPGETLTDKAGNKNGGKSLSTPINIDNTNPNLILDIATPAGTYKANDKIIITATYNENIYKEITSNTLITTGNAPEMTLVFVNEQGNEIPSKGNVSCKQVNGNILTYEYTIQEADNLEGTNGDNGILKIKSLEQVYDAAGNGILGSEKESNIIADTIHPTIISITPDKTGPTNAETITYTVEFSEEVKEFGTDDITVNSGKGTVTSFTGSGKVYYVTITTADNEEYIEAITIAEGVCTDIAGNPNVGLTSSEIVVDRIDPTLTITADKENPTNAEKIIYTFTFSEPINGFDINDITINNEISVKAQELIEVVEEGVEPNTKYTLEVSTADNNTYTEIITVLEESVTDKAGNGNTTVTSSELIIDRIKPIVEKVNLSANAVNQTATITFKATDEYYERSTLTNENIELWINGSKVSSDMITGWTSTNLTDETTSKQYGIQYTVTITGFAQNVNQIKLRIPEGMIEDESGNANVVTDLIVYNTLRIENMDEIDSFEKYVDEIETELNAILTDEFLGESASTTIYPTNSNPAPIKRQDIEKIEFVNNLDNLIEGEIPKVWDTTEKEWNIKTGIQRVWDVSAQGDKSILAWTSQTSAPYTVYVGSTYEIFGNQNSKYLFAGIGSGASATATTTVVNLNALNTSSVTNMYAMFYKCGYKSMTSLDLGDFDTSNVTNMYGMFSNLGYTAMTTFDIGENFDTSKVTNMKMMFSRCGYTAMTSLDLGDKFNTSRVSNMFSMFFNCGYTKMVTLNLGDKFNTSNVASMVDMFSKTGYTSMTNMYFGTENESTGEIILPDNFDTSNVTRMENMFYCFGAMKMTSLDLGNNFDTSNVTNMSGMFKWCGAYEMTTLDLGDKFDTSNVTDMYSMFMQCGQNSMINLDLGDKFDTSNVTDMNSMFMQCGQNSMINLDLGDKFDTSNVTDMSRMFIACGFNSMINLDLGDKFDTSSVEYMGQMFNSCGQNSMINLDLGDKFDTSNVTDMQGMFMFCGMLSMTELDLGPLFTKIPNEAHTNIFVACGKEGELTVYAPEAIYSNRTTFKLNSLSEETIVPENVNMTNGQIEGTRGTIINPIYKPEWEKVQSTINIDEENLENSTISIELKGSANYSETISGTDVKINYSSNVTSSLTEDDITVYINGVMDGDINENGVIDAGETPTITKTLTQANPEVASAVTQTLTLSGFEEASRRTGLPFKELSGNIKIKIGGRGQATGTYGANKLVDQYGNQNMMESDETGTWIDVTLSDAEKEKITAIDESVTEITSTTPVYMFADFIKPEFTYTYSESDINHTNESVTVVFDVTDKYFDSTTLSSLDASQITVRVADYDTTTLNNSITKQLTKTATLVMNKTTKAVTAQSADYTITDANAEQKVGERYQLVVTDLDQEDANGVGDGFKFSGYMSLAFNSGVITDKSGNTSDATTITIGLNENDGEPNADTIHGSGQIVDVVDPIWQLGNISLEEGEVELKAIDKYFGSVTIDEDDILVYVNGKLDGDANENGVLDEGETPNVTKDITSTTPTDIENGKQYTLKLSNITTGGADVTFTPSNLESDGLNNTAGFKYGDENGGNISIKILSGTIADQYGNTSVDQSFEIGNIDATKPRVYPVQNMPNASDGTETIIFNVTDRNYDSTDLITLDVDKNGDGVVDPEITVWLDGNQIDGEVIKELTYKPIYLNATTIVGHQYTLVLSEIVETDEQYLASGRKYRELSGTIEIRIEQDAVKDVKGNILDEDVIISDYIDYIKPEMKEITVANPINTTDKTYTTSFEIRDKYLDDTSEDTQKVQTDEIKVYVDGELATAIAKPETAEAQESNKDKIWMELESTPITATFKKTVNGTIINGTYTVGHTYTLVLSNFEQSVKQSGKNFIEWSGTVKIVIDQNAVNDKNGQTGAVINTLDLDETKRYVGGMHIDFIKPVVEKVDSTRGTNTETIVFDVLDKYLDTSDEVTDGEITVYVDGETATLIKALTKTAKFIMNKETKAVTTQAKDYEVQSTEQVVGERYQLVLSGFEQSSRNAKNYKDWSGTVSIEIPVNAVKDTTGNTLDSNVEKRTLKGDFVDFINPDIKYTHQSTDISAGTKSYTMTFDITDKYYTSGQLDLDDLIIKMQNGQVDTNGNAIVYDLETLATQGKINIAFNAVPYYAEPNITVTNTSGIVQEITTANTYQIGHTYTLTISNLEKFEIETGLTTANYSGIVTVAINGDVIQDRGTSGNGTNPNVNEGKTITSGVNITGGTIPDDAQAVDVVKPRINKVSSSANAVNKIAEITFKGTDTYFVENSTISVDDMKVYVNGIETNSGITKEIKTTTKLEEQRIGNYVQRIEDDALEVQTASVQYGVQYTLEITGFSQNVNQIKVKIPAGKLTDQYGNTNVETDLIVYNTLKMEDMEEVDLTGEKNVDEIESEWNAILTDEFLGESAGTRIYPTNSNPDPIKRQDIEKIEFVNNLNSLLEGEIPKVWDTTAIEWNIKSGIQRVWDVSAQGDKSILAWTTQNTAPYTVYVGSAYEIFGNQNSRYLFAGIGSGSNATATTTIANLNLLNTSSVTNMYAMFYKCGYKSMASLDLGNFDTSNVTNMMGMFSNLGYTAMTTFDIGENFNTSKVTNMGMMFSKLGATAMTSLDLEDKFNTSNVIDMYSMFLNCGFKAMTSLNLGDKFNTSKVQDMSQMFYNTGCMEMTNLYFGTESATRGEITFPDNFNTSNVKRMGGMFVAFGQGRIISLDLGNNFDTSNVTQMKEMFKYCGMYEMINLDLGDKFDTRKVKDMSAMFMNCGMVKMTSLDLGDKFYTTSVTDMSEMFRVCGRMKMITLDLGPAFTKIAETNTDMFSYCGTTGLKIYAPESIYSNRTTFK